MYEKTSYLKGFGFLSMLGAGSIVAVVGAATVSNGTFSVEMFLDFPMALWGSWAVLGTALFFGAK